MNRPAAQAGASVCMRWPGLPARTQLLWSTQEQLNTSQGKGQRNDDGKTDVSTLRSTLLSLPLHRHCCTTPVAHVLADGPCAGHEKKPSAMSKSKSLR